MNDIAMEAQLTQSWKEEQRQRTEQSKADEQSNIFNLPTELIEMVLYHVDDESLLHIRFACRMLKNISLPFFGTRFFKSLTAILHPRSLTALSEIATHPELSKFVTRLTISGEKVGEDIPLTHCVDEVAILQERERMEISWSDRVMLGTVFRKLINLWVVRLDNMSYWHKPRDLRCGMQAIIKRTISDSETKIAARSNWEDHSYYLYTFGIVFSIIENSPNYKTITLELQFSTGINYLLPTTTLWEPYSKEWMQNFAHKVRSLDFRPWWKRDFPWEADMLHFVDHLEKLKICGYCGSLDLSHPVRGMPFCPKLSTFSIQSLRTKQEMITEFFDLHRATLSDVVLDHIGILSGSWKRPLEVMADMQNLQHIRLNDLEELDEPYLSYGSWDNSIPERVLSDEDFAVEGSGREDVVTILQALTLRFRSELTGYLRYTVNMSLACAAVQGVVGYVYGRYVAKDESMET